MLLGFFTWPRSASASLSVVLCQQNVNRRSVIIKKIKTREMEMWRGAISSQSTSVFPCCSDREREAGMEGRRKRKVKRSKGKEK